MKELKIKGKDLLVAHYVFQTALERDRAENHLPDKLSYRIGRLLKHLSNDHQPVKEKQIELVKRFGEEVMEDVPLPKNAPPGTVAEKKGTGNWRVKTEHLEEYQKEWAIIGDDEITISFEPIPEAIATTPRTKKGEELKNFTTEEYILILDFIGE